MENPLTLLIAWPRLRVSGASCSNYAQQWRRNNGGATGRRFYYSAPKGSGQSKSLLLLR